MAGQTQTPPPADGGDGEIDARAHAIAEEFGTTVAQASKAIRHLVDGLPSLSSQRQGSPSSHIIDYAGRFLHAACWGLGPQAAFTVVDQTPLDLLETRVWATHYLSRSDEEIPLYIRKDLADQLVAFREFLIGDRLHLLQTGLPSQDFPSCRWLWLKLGTLYPIKRAENQLPFVEPIECGGAASHYKWVRAEFDDNGIGVALVPCRQCEADFITGLTEDDAERLVQWRETILDVKLAVLAEAAQFLRSQNQDDLLGRCVSHFKDAPITADDVRFLISIDRIYSEPPMKWKTDPVIASMGGYAGPLEPGGVTNLLELIGHVEKEQAIGTMHKTREALGDLVGIEEGCARLRDAAGPWPYFQIVRMCGQAVIDRAIDIFCECDDREGVFWKQFQGRVATAIENELPCSTPGSFAHRLQLTIQGFRNSQRRLNVFRWADNHWEIQFKGGPLNVYPDRDGFLYLSCLIQAQHQASGLLPSKLRAAKAQFVGANSRSVMAADSTADTSNSSTDAGELIDREAREEYRKRLDKIEDELEEAREFNNESRISDLEEEKGTIIAGLRAAIGLGGRTTRISRAEKNVRDAVKKAINRAVEEIGRKDAALATHFSKSLELTDLFAYRSEHPIVWVDH